VGQFGEACPVSGGSGLVDAPGGVGVAGGEHAEQARDEVGPAGVMGGQAAAIDQRRFGGHGGGRPDVLEDGADEDVEVDGLGHVGVHAGLQAAGLLFGHRVGGLADDGQARGDRADAPGGLVAVHLRHLDIHQHHVEGGRAGGFYALDGAFAVVDHLEPGAFALQDFLEHQLVHLVVLGGQDVQPSRRAPGSALACPAQG
jgi:hypothetical protein